MSKTKVIAFANNKGGSGKTTSCSNIGCALSMMGKKVLMIDGDMQLNLTLSFFDEEKSLDYASNGKNIYTAIKEEKDLSDFVVATEYEGLDIIPSTSLMSAIEFDLFPKWQREFILKKCLEPIRARGYYDYILIDSPPTLGCWVMNIMCASDFVVIPVEASPWEISPRLNVMGIMVTKADERKKYFKETLETLKATEDIRVFNAYVKVDSAIEWSQDISKPVVAYKKYSRSALEYKSLAKEIVEYANR